MRKFCDPFFFADVSSSAITTSFQQVHLGRSEAPSEMQVIHSEQVALERPGALCSTLEGVECPPFFRCEAPPLLQFAILSCQRVPQTPHFGGLPAPAKQTLNRLPIVMTKCDGDPIIPRTKLDADLFHFVEPRGGEEIATFPEYQCVAQFQPFQYRPKLRDPRVIVKRILQSKSSRKLQPDGKFRLRPPMKFETVFAFL